MAGGGQFERPPYDLALHRAAARRGLTPSQLLAACATGVELAEVLEYDQLEPPLSRRELIQLAGDLLAKLHNAHFTGPALQAQDFYPELRPADWQERQRRRVQLDDQRHRLAQKRQHGDGQP